MDVRPQRLAAVAPDGGPSGRRRPTVGFNGADRNRYDARRSGLANGLNRGRSRSTTTTGPC